mmetsp:Transcript_95996/g.309958  ORF Transcript_95996/g.309958 Transcript_95996/m.309958 type:complete len:208 (-) Transcript_95996:392-1015(-)
MTYRWRSRSCFLGGLSKLQGSRPFGSRKSSEWRSMRTSKAQWCGPRVASPSSRRTQTSAPMRAACCRRCWAGTRPRRPLRRRRPAWLAPCGVRLPGDARTPWRMAAAPGGRALLSWAASARAALPRCTGSWRPRPSATSRSRSSPAGGIATRPSSSSSSGRPTSIAAWSTHTCCVATRLLRMQARCSSCSNWLKEAICTATCRVKRC